MLQRKMKMKSCSKLHGFKSLYSSVFSVLLMVIVVGNLYIMPRAVRSLCTFPLNCRPKHEFTSPSNCSTESGTDHVTSVTMFTTFPFVKNKFDINLNTLRNWKHMYNSPKLILFTDDQKVASAGINSDWPVQNITTEAVTEAPALSTLFLESVKGSDTYLYMYANADILFDRYLIEILSIVEVFLKSNNLHKKPVLIVGQRTNINILSIDSKGPEAWKTILRESYTIYTRFQKNAIDYFITNSFFPWSEVPKLVIGRVGYDNWIIAYARFRGFVTIDASSVISAIHQTNSKGNFEGFQNGNWDFNRELIKKTGPPFNYAIWGQTNCCTYHVIYDDCSRVQVLKRPDVPVYCDRLHLSSSITHSLFGTDVYYMGYKQGS
ncbi:uncharacterized protein LOC110454200 [Mizuhopecten yessoensis]|uniref:Nucleotide-diphospho-sugar transferase domain-containing protein n=1 Tax=Mizuhopecten yessoensis TaxID=6573 RepID=A0A210QFP5_MIZYE|nr:uncharacterized protein LOC110454200 [Mizuhopecten yessoensis]OWF47564.1 hypothetical protein KP79_PYT01291 [Mizuhopecten yessoensis]